MARDWIRDLRVKKFPNQAALAEAAGITPSRLSRIEKGYCDIKPDEAAVLARVLETTESIIQGKAKASVEVPRALSALEVDVPAPTKLTIPEPKGLAAAQSVAPVQASAPTPAAAAVTPTIVHGVRNDDLSNPATFNLMPPAESLEQGALDFRARLQKQISFANKVLHTSRVKPAIWRAWRDFEKAAQERLRGGLPAPVAVSNSAPAPLPKPAEVAVAVAPVIPMRARDEAEDAENASRTGRHRRNKNHAGHFFAAAKDKLPAQTVEELVSAAGAAKDAQPEYGFMKHFVRLTEQRIPSEQFSMLHDEAARRLHEQVPPELQKSG